MAVPVAAPVGVLLAAPLVASAVPDPSVVMVGTMFYWFASSRIFGRRGGVCRSASNLELIDVDDAVGSFCSLWRDVLGVDVVIDIKAGGSSSRRLWDDVQCRWLGVDAGVDRLVSDPNTGHVCVCW